MRVLIIDHLYEGFVRDHYRSQPRLREAAYEAQVDSLATAWFGETQFQVDALRHLGHEATFLPINVIPLVAAWARERRASLPRPTAIVLSHRGRPRRVRRPAWQTGLLAEWARRFDPDVIHVQSMHALSSDDIRAIRPFARLISSQSAAPVFPARQLPDYDVFFSSLPKYVESAARSGKRSHYLPLAFDERASLAAHSWTERDVGLSFVGSLPASHHRRARLLAHVAGHVRVDIWSEARHPGWASESHALLHGPAWGRDMYDVLARSRLTINVHGEHAVGYANNLRLFEATGMGALLVTDGTVNITDLFVPADEVITFHDEEGLLRAVRHYLDHPEEAQAIAARGQARTLRDHTWKRRMARFVELLDVP